MKKCIILLFVLLGVATHAYTQTTKVYADFSNPTCTSEAQWDATTQTLSWTKQYGNQLKGLKLPSGDISQYEKLVIETADLKAQSFRILVYIGSNNITFTVASEGIVEFKLDDQLDEEQKKNITEICLSGGNADETGSVRILNFYIETYDESSEALKKSPEISYSTNYVGIEQGEAFTAPTFNNPNGLPVVFSVKSEPEGFITINETTGEVAIGEGTGYATITAKSESNEEYKAGKATYVIAVKAAGYADIPYVYEQENTGSFYPEPNYPNRSELPFIEPLTDPFLYSDGSGRATEFQDWARRRSEIANEIQHYEIGQKPAIDPSAVSAKMEGNKLSVTVTVNGKTLNLSATINYPSGEGPFPLMIGTSGISLPTAVFDGGAIATMTYNESQLNGYSQFSDNGSREFERLYPELANNGAYSEWAWGLSRLLDGLQLLGPEVTRIDMKHIGVTGCSYAGKMALFCGAFDERIALTIAQEPGGGGAASWRASHWLPTNVEKIDNTDYNWFMSSLRNNFGSNNVSNLPYDHHELCAMICPRALLIVGNPSMEWLADPSGYISSNAARKVWEQFGIEDRMGYTFVGHGDHCVLPQSQYPEVRAFINRFLLGKEEVNTNDILIAPANFKDAYDYTPWISWWGTEVEYPLYLGNGEDKEEHCAWIEAEDMITSENGQNFRISTDASCSGGKYVETVVNDGNLSNDKKNWLIGKFTIEAEDDYNVIVRVNTNGSYDDDSYFFAFDNNTPIRSNGLAAGGSSWSWMNLETYADGGESFNKHLLPGEHQVVIVGREDGAKIDKVYITNLKSLPKADELGPVTDIEKLTVEGLCIYSIRQDENRLIVNIHADSPATASIQVFNAIGVSVANVSSALRTGIQEIAIGNISQPGFHIISLQVEGQTVTQSIMIK